MRGIKITVLRIRHKWMHVKFKGDDHEYHISYSVCEVCGIQRKKRRDIGDLYKTKDGVTIIMWPRDRVPSCINPDEL